MAKPSSPLRAEKGEFCKFEDGFKNGFKFEDGFNNGFM